MEFVGCAREEGERTRPDGRAIVWTDPGCAIWEYGCENRCTTEAERVEAESADDFPDADCAAFDEYPGDCVTAGPDACDWSQIPPS
jgi:hypothetical protein